MMKQVGVDICNLPETDGYCRVIVLINYFCKWSEAKPKNSLVKVLEDNHEMWPQMIERILFANRVSRRSLTKYSPFMMLYNREPALPIDAKHNLDREKEGEIEDENQEPFDL